MFICRPHFNTEQTNACRFSENYIYNPSCFPQIQKIVVSSQLHWLLVSFGQLYIEIHIVRKRKFTQALGIQIEAQRNNIKMDICSYFRRASKSSVVFSSSDCEDGNESEIDVQPNPPKKHCTSSTSKPPSKSGSGIRRYNKKWELTFPCLEFDENLQGIF